MRLQDVQRPEEMDEVQVHGHFYESCARILEMEVKERIKKNAFARMVLREDES